MVLSLGKGLLNETNFTSFVSSTDWNRKGEGNGIGTGNESSPTSCPRDKKVQKNELEKCTHCCNSMESPASHAMHLPLKNARYAQQQLLLDEMPHIPCGCFKNFLWLFRKYSRRQN